MLGTMRKIFGPAAVGVIIGAIALVFVFYGVFSPKTGGMGARNSVATVNGESISGQDFEREYRGRLDYFAQMFGGKTDPALLEKLGIRRQVLDELVNRKLIGQAAKASGLVVSDAEVRDKIQEMPYFKKEKEGTFDPITYKKVLAANNRSPSEFEGLVREDLMREKFMGFFQGIARVSEAEIRDEFQFTENKRTVEYLLLNRDSIRKQLVVNEKEIAEFMAKPENMELAKKHYEQTKSDYMKPEFKVVKPPKKGEKPKPVEYQAFEDVKRKVVVELLKDRRVGEMSDMNKKLADEMMAKAKTSVADLKAFAKGKGYEVKTSNKFNRQEPIAPGIGSLEELSKDAFSESAPLAKEARRYDDGTSIVIAWGAKAFTPDEKEFTKQKETLSNSVKNRKSQSIYKSWMDGLNKKASISIMKGFDQATSGSES